jgi:hypothetical protein
MQIPPSSLLKKSCSKQIVHRMVIKEVHGQIISGDRLLARVGNELDGRQDNNYQEQEAHEDGRQVVMPA